MKVLVVTNMYPTPEKPAAGTFVQEQVESLRRESVDVDVFCVDGSKNKLAYLWGLFRFWGRLLRKRYDIIHAHYVFSGFIARAQYLYPVVLTHHGLEVFMTWQRFPSRFITPLVDQVILVSEEQKRKLGCQTAEIIPCGINLDFFKPVPREEARQKLNLPMDKKLVLWVGNHRRPEKRYDIVEKAIALAKAKDPSVELVLVDGKPHDVVPLYMSAGDAVLLVSDAEGSPMVIHEAMACNLPIVSVPVGDVPEVIGGTEGCYLCTQDPADVADKLALALQFTGRTSGRENIKYMEEGHTARRILNLYRKVLQQRNRTALESMVPDKAGKSL
ncbi:MAG: glycosyltransferase family 4 protein [Dehalococcoidales bacterium]|jgi:glycosyltransferase involved in cell wall biosynthesis